MGDEDRTRRDADLPAHEKGAWNIESDIDSQCPKVESKKGKSDTSDHKGQQGWHKALVGLLDRTATRIRDTQDGNDASWDGIGQAQSISKGSC